MHTHTHCVCDVINRAELKPSSRIISLFLSHSKYSWMCKRLSCPTVSFTITLSIFSIPEEPLNLGSTRVHVVLRRYFRGHRKCPTRVSQHAGAYNFAVPKEMGGMQSAGGRPQPRVVEISHLPETRYTIEFYLRCLELFGRGYCEASFACIFVRIHCVAFTTFELLSVN